MSNQGSFSQRVVAWNARSWHVPAFLVAVVLGIVIAGLVLAIAVPILPRGTLREWMVWLVVLACVLLVFGAQTMGAKRARARR